jgi:hypothetical protein
MISYRYQYLLDNICFSMATKSSGRIKIQPELPVPGTMAYYCCKATDPPLSSNGSNKKLKEAMSTPG